MPDKTREIFREKPRVFKFLGFEHLNISVATAKALEKFLHNAITKSKVLFTRFFQ